MRFKELWECLMIRAGRQRAVLAVAAGIATSLIVAASASAVAAATSGHRSPIARAAGGYGKGGMWVIYKQIAVCNNMRHANRYNPHNLYYVNQQVYNQCQSLYRTYGTTVPKGLSFTCSDAASAIGGALGGFIGGVVGDVPGGYFGGAIGGFAGSRVC